jgi:flavin-binding protein dodecin
VSDHIYRVTEIVGTSDESVAQAIRNGVARVGRTVRNVEWFEVLETRGSVHPDGTLTFQVGLKVGFRLEG